MLVHALDPLRDPRWSDLVARHPAASVFHTRAWLEALQRTYGYEPVVLTTCPPDTPLTSGIVVCRVRSWLTGRYLVSLPFADHCDLLVDRHKDVAALLSGLRQMVAGEWKYVELRPLAAAPSGESCLQPASAFSFHVLDL